MGNWATLHTQSNDEVINLYEGLSDHFTYRQYRYDKNRTQSDRIRFEHEPDIFETMADSEEYEYTLDSLAELGLDIENVKMVQYEDEDNFGGKFRI